MHSSEDEADAEAKVAVGEISVGVGQIQPIALVKKHSRPHPGRKAELYPAVGEPAVANVGEFAGVVEVGQSGPHAAIQGDVVAQHLVVIGHQHHAERGKTETVAILKERLV